MNKEEIENAKKECKEIIGNFNSATTEHTKDIFPKKANAIEILLEYIIQLETSKQKLIDKLEKDKMEQFDDYNIYLIESYLEIVKGK